MGVSFQPRNFYLIQTIPRSDSAIALGGLPANAPRFFPELPSMTDRLTPDHSILGLVLTLAMTGNMVVASVAGAGVPRRLRMYPPCRQRSSLRPLPP